MPQLVVVTTAVAEFEFSSLHTSSGFAVALLLFAVPDDDVTDDDTSTIGTVKHVVAAVAQVVEMSVVFVTVVNDVSGVHIDGVTNNEDIEDDGVDIDADSVDVVAELLCMLPLLPAVIDTEPPAPPLLVVAAPMAGGDIDGLELIELVVAVADDDVEFAARSRPPVFCCCSRCNLKMEKPRLYEDSSESSWGSCQVYLIFVI